MEHREFSLTDVHATGTKGSGGCGCGGGGCGGHHEHGGHGHAGHGHHAVPTSSAETVTRIGVTGMTCGHCVAAVREEVGAIPGVTGVDVELHPGETSTVLVHSAGPIADDAIDAAVDEAGYAVAR